MSLKKRTSDSLLLKKFEVQSDFSKIFLDAFILINKEKKILKFNAAFCNLVELQAQEVKEISFLDGILIANTSNRNEDMVQFVLKSRKPLRIDDIVSTNVKNQKNLNLIVSSYPYFNSAKKIIGACLLIRNVTAERTLQTKYKSKKIESITDPLTGLYTRRFFESMIEKELARCKEQHKKPSFSLMMLDLDKFKSINDTYGHQAGDHVLVETAKIIKTHTRKSDIQGRYGGEELIILIFDADEKIASMLAEKFRKLIQAHKYTFEGKKIPVTASIGLTLINSYDDDKANAIKRADACLYYAKKNGRNITVVDFGNGVKKATELVPLG